jgi:hypothetical protein
MKMAKASEEEFEEVMKFANELEEEIKYPEKTDKELREWIEKAPCLFRVVWGYKILVDNACKPDSGILEWNDKILKALEFYKEHHKENKDNE